MRIWQNMICIIKYTQYLMIYYTEHTTGKRNSNNVMYACFHLEFPVRFCHVFSLLSISAFISLIVSSFIFLSITSFSIITSWLSLLEICFCLVCRVLLALSLPCFRLFVFGDFHMIHHQIYFHSYSLHTQPQASVDVVFLGLKLCHQSHRIQKNHPCSQESYQVLN